MAINTSRIWMDRELDAFAASLADGMIVLDAGAGLQTYAPKFLRQKYEAADFEMVNKPYAKSTYVCDLRAIPVESERFDAIVFTQVMEHLPEPQEVLREFARVLKPGGRIFFSAPLYYQEHEQPYDYYRYTQFALRYMFEKVGFEIDELRWLEGFLGTAAHKMRYVGRYLPRKSAGYGGGLTGLLLLIALQFFGIQMRLFSTLASLADKRHRYTRRGMPMNYMAVLRKPL